MAAGTIGRYVVREEIGQGGMATVYRALDPHFERDVAIKVLPQHFLHDPRFRARFEREARIVAGLQHPAIVPVYDFGEDNGQPYLVMALMSGGSLEDRLRGGPMALAETERIIGRLAPALDAAHQRGIIHRDLKPANILFDQWNEPYLTDFGIVKLTQANDGPALTTIGGILGTPAYMSPEQVQGGEIDDRSDTYSFGVILFQMLSGRLPYDAPTPIGLAFKHVSEPVPSLVALQNVRLPAEYQTLIDRSMAKQPADRYPTAVAMARDLTRLVHGSGPQPTIVLPRDPTDLLATQLVAEKPITGPVAAEPPPPSAALVAVAAAPAAGATDGNLKTAMPPATGAPVPAPAPLEATPAAGGRRRFPAWLLGLAALLLIGGVGAFLLLRDEDEPPASTPEPTTLVAAAGSTAEATEENAAIPTDAPEQTTTQPAATEPPTAAATKVIATAVPLKTAVTPLAPTAATTVALVRVSVSSANVRGGPGIAYPVVGRVEQGDELEVIGRTQDSAWYNILMPDGDPGWLSANVVAADDPEAVAAAPVAGTIPAPPAQPTAPPTTLAPTAGPIQPTSPPDDGGGGGDGEQPTRPPNTPVPPESTPVPP